MDDLTWYLLVWASITVPGVLLGWLRVFPKAGQPAWAALLPFYNVYVLVVGVARLSALWFVLVWVPIVQLVAAILADIAVGKPLNGMVEMAGPEPIRMDEVVRRYLTATGDARTVTTDPNARYYGIEVNDRSLTPGDNPRLGPTRFEEWLSRSVPRK